MVAIAQSMGAKDYRECATRGAATRRTARGAMKVFYIVITAWAPYPIEFKYSVPGSNVAVAGAKALRTMRKDLIAKTRKRCTNYSIKINVA